MTTGQRSSQIRVRVSPEFKKAVKMFCVREGTTEQRWVVELLEGELARRAPGPWFRWLRDRKRWS